ncbi:hypothetical protein PG985_015072 [Apiospora marii]|uniref:uncharacterized protein n=1 Tax=Apiospora marii TaxID=335849 RepID=UPI00312E35BA
MIPFRVRGCKLCQERDLLAEKRLDEESDVARTVDAAPTTEERLALEKKERVWEEFDEDGSISMSRWSGTGPADTAPS